MGAPGSPLADYAHDWEGFWKPKNSEIGAVSCREVKFPKPRGLHVNMMPFVIGDAASIPRDLRGYLRLLASCPISRGEWGQVGYLTIDERHVEKGASQRRPGIHVESVLLTADAGWWPMEGRPMTLAWGAGQVLEDDVAAGHLEGGLFMATNLPGSCRVWNRRLDPRLFGTQDFEPLRPFLGDGYDLDANELVWITDQTPHESCVLPSASPRQFFRFVTSKVDVWYADHSTPNPLGVQVPGHVHVVHGNKFTKPDRYTRLHQVQQAARAASQAARERRRRIHSQRKIDENHNGGTEDYDEPKVLVENKSDLRKVAEHIIETTSPELTPPRFIEVGENPWARGNIKEFPDYEMD